MTRAEAIRAIAGVYKTIEGEFSTSDADVDSIRQEEIDALHALGVTSEEYEEALAGGVVE